MLNFLGLNDNHSNEDLIGLETIKYLLLQLAIALDNIRILRNLQEQEKIAAIGTFSSGIIHNLKNPIDGLRMIIEMLKKEIKESDPKKEYVEELFTGIMQLKQKLIHSFDFVNYDDETLQSEILYLHKDYVGSPIAVTDIDGNLLEQYTYDPYGTQFML